jgi:hypothetical protein
MIKSLMVAVVEDSGNRSPILTALDPRTLRESDALVVTIVAQDPDGDPLTYTAQNLPEGAVFKAATATISWTPSATQAGQYVIRCSVSDGTTTASGDLAATVQQKSRVIRGRIRAGAGKAVANVSVRILGNGKTLMTVKSDSTGNYRAGSLPVAPSYTIKPVASSTVKYTPASRTADLSVLDALKEDFTQSPK